MKSQVKKRLIVLSDLWGREKSEWIENYTQILKKDFDIIYYDSCELGGIDKSDYREDKLHQQFINGGIQRAVEKLNQLEKEKVNILAFSIGGSIAWKFGLDSKRIESLYCVSSTRLRHETVRPSGNIELYFGEKDNYRPSKEWLVKMAVNYKILDEKEHQFYRERKFSEELSKHILKTLTQAGPAKKIN